MSNFTKSDPLDRDGVFRCKPVYWTVQPSKDPASKSVSIRVCFKVLEMLEAKTWLPWAEYDMVVWGNYCIIKRDGSPNVETIEKFVKYMGCPVDGIFAHVANSQAPDTIVQVRVQAEDWQGKVQYKAGWINASDYVPERKAKKVDPAVAGAAKILDAQFGSRLRAVMGASSKPPIQKPASPANDGPLADAIGEAFPGAKEVSSDDSAPF